MVKVTCPLPGCGFQTEDQEASIVAVLLQIHASTHATAAGGGTQVRGPKLDRPRIDTGADQEAWNTFLRRWDAFRVGSGVSDSMASVQLLQCASEELSERLLKAIPQIEAHPLDEVLRAMQSLAVIPVARGIVRAELMRMRQGNDESFRAFTAKVRGKAETCGFTLNATSPCACRHRFDLDYTVEVIRDVLLAGIGNDDIKQHVLSTEGVAGTSINELVALVEKREMASNAVSRNWVMSSAADDVARASLSTFRQKKKSMSIETSIPCPECGEAFRPYRKTRHGVNERPFKQCLRCYRSGRPRPMSGARSQNAGCDVVDARSPPSEFTRSQERAQDHYLVSSLGNEELP